MTPQFVDISSFQGNVDFVAYCAWSKQWDGISRIAMKATEGTGFTDPLFKANRAAALAAGIDCIYYYHYGRPDLNAAIAEANFMDSVVGDIRAQDIMVLDFEENVSQATSEWAYEWLSQMEANYGKLPALYASSAYIAARLTDSRLAKFPLWLANWEYSPDERPPVPAPWAGYAFVQYSDKASIPGIPGTVDADIFLGGNTMATTIPDGWTDDGTTLTAPNKIPVVLGFRDYVLANNWDANNWPLEAEQHLTTIEQSNPSLGGGQAQTFRNNRLEYTPKLGIFEGWLGQELLWYKQDVAQLMALITTSNLQQINTLAAQIVQKSQVQ